VPGLARATFILRWPVTTPPAPTAVHPIHVVVVVGSTAVVVDIGERDALILAITLIVLAAASGCDEVT
jgi:hypothetical protein